MLVRGSKLARAVTYAQNQKSYMENYLLDGRCSISNQYLQIVLMYMPDWDHSEEYLEDMMPWSDFVKKQCSR